MPRARLTLQPIHNVQTRQEGTALHRATSRKVRARPMFLQELVATSRFHARASMNFEGVCCLVDEIPQVTNNSPPTNPNTRQLNKPSPQTATTPRKMLLFAEAKRTSRQAPCQTQHMIVFCAFRRGEMRVVDFSCVSSRRKRLFARGGAQKRGPQGRLLSKATTKLQ